MPIALETPRTGEGVVFRDVGAERGDVFDELGRSAGGVGVLHVESVEVRARGFGRARPDERERGEVLQLEIMGPQLERVRRRVVGGEVLTPFDERADGGERSCSVHEGTVAVDRPPPERRSCVPRRVRAVL